MKLGLALLALVLVSGCTQTGSVVVDPVITSIEPPEPIENISPSIEVRENITIPDNTTPTTCLEHWNCGPWSTCIDNLQSRNCTDVSACSNPSRKPNTSQSCTNPHVIFSEVLYDTLGKTGEEWIELENPTPFPVNLGNWSLSDNSGTWKFPSFQIAANSFAVIARDAVAFRALTNCQPDLIGFSRGLNNNGDQLTMLDEDSRQVDFVAWESGANNKHPAWRINAGKGKTIRRSSKEASPKAWLSNQNPDPAC